MMMAVKPNAGVAGGLAELGLTLGGDATVDGEAFTAILANLAPASEGEGAETAPVGVEEIAKQLAAMITGAVATAKAPVSATAKNDAESPETSEDAPEEGAKADGDPAASAAIAVLAAQTIAEPSPAASPTTATTSEITVDASVLEGSEAPQAKITKTIASTGTGAPLLAAAALPAEAPMPEQAIAAAAPALPGTEAKLAKAVLPAMAEEAVETPVPTAAKSAAPAPAATQKLDAPAPAAALQALLQLGGPALTRAFAAAAKATPTGEVKSAAPAPANDAKASGAAGFLASTILPLLPESLHAAVLGQNAPADAVTGSGETTQPLDAAEQVIEQQLDLAHEGEWLDQLAKDIARSAGKDSGLRFRLHPETLGSLHVEMTQGPAGASIRMTADTEAARAIIADAQPKLVAEARAHGLRIAESHVDLGAGGQQGSADPRRQEDLQQQQRFVRTAAAEKTEAATPDPRTDKVAERYA